MIHPVIDALLQEPKPRKFELPQPNLPNRPAPIDKAWTGFVLAVRTVADADYQQELADWRERQDTLLGFRSELDAEAAAASSNDLGSGDRRLSDDELAQAMFGTARWAEILDEIERMQRWGARRADESARKAKQFTKGVTRALSIRERFQEQFADLSDRLRRRGDELGEHADPATIQHLLQEADIEAKALSDKAVAKIHTQIRYILNLDDNTAAVSTADWLRRHGLLD